MPRSKAFFGSQTHEKCNKKWETCPIRIETSHVQRREVRSDERGATEEQTQSDAGKRPKLKWITAVKNKKLKRYLKQQQLVRCCVSSHLTLPSNPPSDETLNEV